MRDAEIPTIADHHETWFARPDVAERVKPLLTAVHKAWQVIDGFCNQIVQRVEALPPSPGYGPYLTERRINPIAARMLAGLLVRRGTRMEEESLRILSVVEALRFLAGSRKKKSAIILRVKLLLSAWGETSIIETIFCDAGLSEFEFIEVLKAVAQGHWESYRRVFEIAASIVPMLSVSRGPKVSAASAAHEFFLEAVVKPTESRTRTYTYASLVGDYTDPMTLATRREFNDPHFAPVSARRRLKNRQTKN